MKAATRLQAQGGPAKVVMEPAENGLGNHG